ncbi:hypothetical protein AMECASPLE_003757 [Ameca splendens]|uniref:Uncharacterized protein n=1 Tax=Ameca splendens TaxID=208324 RepID=A0ABV0Y9L5_9TELE
MKLNTLCLNGNKIEVVLLGKSDLLTGCKSAIGPLDSFSCDSVRSLRVIFDTDLKFVKQVSAVVQSSFYHFRLNDKIKPNLPQNVVLSITTKQDYCISLHRSMVTKTN